MILIKEFEFDAAHYLPEYNGKCEKLHGHTYKLVVKIDGTPDKEGMVIDFVRLKEIVKEAVLNKLDHSCINDILPQPSAESVTLSAASSVAAGVQETGIQTVSPERRVSVKSCSQMVRAVLLCMASTFTW